MSQSGNLDHVLDGPADDSLSRHPDERVDAPPEEDEAVEEATPPTDEDQEDHPARP